MMINRRTINIGAVEYRRGVGAPMRDYVLPPSTYLLLDSISII
jgi:hypothetical protein